MADDKELPGEIVDVPYDDDEDKMTGVEEQEDGSAIVTIDDTSVESNPDFYANLVEDIDTSALSDITVELLDKIEKDKQAREKRDAQYEEGIRRTGLGDDAPGGAQFSGASRVVHPVMAEACVDFVASAIKELFPPQGPVRSSVIGKSDKDKMAKADRKTEHMNWQLTEQVDEYRTELEQMLTQLPLGGSQYMKMYWNADEERPAAEAVFIDDVFLPFSAGNFYTAPRITHRQYVDKYTYADNMTNGVWRDVDEMDGEEPEGSKASKASDKIEGKKSSSYNEDGVREVYEIYTKLNLDDDSFCDSDRAAPYIITIDVQTEEVLSIYRNWEDGDDTYTKLDWLIEYQFIPWRGAYGIGLPHLIGGLSAALTGSLRALLDSAHISNAPTLLKLKGARLGGQTQEVAVTQVQEIEGPAGIDDIKKLAMPMPFNQPSPVLFQLMGWLDSAAKGVVSTSEEKIADASNSMPVGTAMALIEHGSKVYSSIHARLHRSQERSLKVLHRLNRMYLPDKVKFGGDVMVYRKDYEGDMDVVPVSDPNIFSETQRFAQLQALAQRASVVPGLYNLPELERRILSMMRIADSDKLLAAPPEPKRQNAANENVTMYLGSRVTAFPDQDHFSHIETHLDFLECPALGGDADMGVAFQQSVIEHLKQHIAFFYATAMYQTASAALGNPAEDYMRDPKLEKDFDKLMAASSKPVVQTILLMAGKFAPIIAKAIQMIKARQQPPPMDPGQAAIHATQMQLQVKQASDQQANAIKAQQLQLSQQELEFRQKQHQDSNAEKALTALNEARMTQAQQVIDANKYVGEAKLKASMQMKDLQADAQIAQANNDAKIQMSQADNQAALAITALKIATTGKAGDLTNGEGINPNPGV
jgi:hypothetical protein